MKKLFLMTFVACFAMMFASCEKEMKLDGTTWTTQETIKQNLSYQGVPVEATFNLESTLNFTDATQGILKMKIGGMVTVMGQTAPIPENNLEDPFAYNFDGERGELYSGDPNDTERIPFTYNKSDKTIVIDFKLPGDALGTDINFHLVYKQQ